MIRIICEGNNKGTTRISDWSIFTKAIGIFLPKRSFPDGYRKTLLGLAFQGLRSKIFGFRDVDFFSYAVLANYTGTERAHQCTLPGFLIDTAIPIRDRCELAEKFNVGAPTKPTTGFMFGTKEWCLAESYCIIEFYQFKTLLRQLYPSGSSGLWYHKI